jgi:hypothetical protein
VEELLRICQNRWASYITGVNVMSMLEDLVLNAIPEEYGLATGYHFVSTLKPGALFMRCSSEGFEAKLVYDYNVVVEVVASNGVVKSVRVRTIEDLTPCC